jgi:hypothetical protein
MYFIEFHKLTYVIINICYVIIGDTLPSRYYNIFFPCVIIKYVWGGDDVSGGVPCTCPSSCETPSLSYQRGGYTFVTLHEGRIVTFTPDALKWRFLRVISRRIQIRRTHVWSLQALHIFFYPPSHSWWKIKTFSLWLYFYNNLAFAKY